LATRLFNAATGHARSPRQEPCVTPSAETILKLLPGNRMRLRCRRNSASITILGDSLGRHHQIWWLHHLAAERKKSDA